MRRILVLLYVLTLLATAQEPKPTNVLLGIAPDPTGKALLRWTITNNSKQAVYVYDFFLWGPTEWVEEKGGITIIGTSPSKEQATCPPNRVAPVLLLVVAPGRKIEGYFEDDRLKLAPDAKVAMRIAVFGNPYSVVERAKSFANSNCKHSPYDALIQEGTIIESAPMTLR